jgi:ferric-dicitrate binding protein FerR (iron transport regulator)
LDGEGYFNVKKDEQRPFIVKAPSYDVKVLSTEFNVLDYAKSSLFEVSLLKGNVEVLSKDKSKRIKLEPNTMAYLSAGKLIKKTMDNYNHLFWKDGLISFDDEPVEKMINKLELYYDVNIIIQNAAVAKQKYTGKFRTKDGIEHILKVFQLKDKFTYEKDDETNTIIIR